LGTGGRDVAKDAFSIGDKNSYKMVILSNGNVGINAITPQATLDVRGDAVQSRGAGGFAKAMIFVKQDGTIDRCYNSQATGSAVSTPPCGFTISHDQSGRYIIDFGFKVSDRFYSVTPYVHDTEFRNVGVKTYLQFNQNELWVFTFFTSDDSDITDNPFTVIIF